MRAARSLPQRNEQRPRREFFVGMFFLVAYFLLSRFTALPDMFTGLLLGLALGFLVFNLAKPRIARYKAQRSAADGS